jgi:molybdopterin-biosynthesis enzyme MoeA-like protein
MEVVPDEKELIVDSLHRCVAACDHVFTSGGIGPTHDDVTIASVAAAFGVAVEESAELLALLQRYYGELSQTQRRIAEIPAGAELIYGEDPLWPVILFNSVYILPGVPKLFRRKFLAIRDRFRDQPSRVGRIFCTVDEHQLAPALDRAVADFSDVEFGSYPTFDETDYRVLVTVESRNSERVEAAMSHLSASLGDWIWRTEEPN